MSDDKAEEIKKVEKRIEYLRLAVEKTETAIADRLENPFIEKQLDNDVSKRKIKYEKLSDLENTRTKFLLELDSMEYKLKVLQGKKKKKSKVKTIYIKG